MSLFVDGYEGVFWQSRKEYTCQGWNNRTPDGRFCRSLSKFLMFVEHQQCAFFRSFFLVDSAHAHHLDAFAVYHFRQDHSFIHEKVDEIRDWGSCSVDTLGRWFGRTDVGRWWNPLYQIRLWRHFLSFSAANAKYCPRVGLRLHSYPRSECPWCRSASSLYLRVSFDGSHA